MHPVTENNLTSYNTFGLDARCKGIIHIHGIEDVKRVIQQKLEPVKILGGGSNVLITKDQEAWILRNEIKGIEVIASSENQVLVQVGAGESWNGFVEWALHKNLGGIENLVKIPGSVGAAPMQNIGAYGVEQDQVFQSLDAIHLESGELRKFTKEACMFGYRESIFKRALKDQFFITHVTYLLTNQKHVLHLEYGAIRDVMASEGIVNPTIQDVAAAVKSIRTSKLPDPAMIGNAGSFFKNPTIPVEIFEALKQRHPNIPGYRMSDAEVKVPAGWLIEKAGWKGNRLGNAGVHDLQALVLVNHGNASGYEIWQLAQKIMNDIESKFKIRLEAEVNIW
jgi:UDP-N-acetylmuramate dehydrogenase